MTDDLTHDASYWIGYLSTTLAVAHREIRRNESSLAREIIDAALRDFVASGHPSAALVSKIEEEWKPDRPPTLTEIVRARAHGGEGLSPPSPAKPAANAVAR